MITCVCDRYDIDKKIKHKSDIDLIFIKHILLYFFFVILSQRNVNDKDPLSSLPYNVIYPVDIFTNSRINSR